MNLKNPIICALDLDSLEKALQIVESLTDNVGAYKIGPRFSIDQKIIRHISKYAPVFLDYKYFDIPTTMLAGVKTCFDLGASIVTVHALSGKVALKELKKLELELQSKRAFHIACVTVLTSFDKCLPENFKDLDVTEHVKILAKSVFDAGLDTVVCSPLEASFIREKYQNANIITPGIKFGQIDQKRVCSEKEAIKNGSDALVIGRAIINSKDPKKEVFNILSKLKA